MDAGVDLYTLLGIEPTASRQQIVRAYRRLAHAYHPDVNASSDAAEQFARITHAYRILSDPAARARYDAARAAARSTTAGRRPSAVRQRWSSWADGWPDASGRAGDAFWLGGPSFSHAFTTGLDTEAAAGQAGRGDEAELELTVEEAYLGASRTVRVTDRGQVETVQVVIPPGVITGEQVQVRLTHLPAGHGDPTVSLRVRLAAHERFRVDGRDVHVALPLSPWEAALGASITIDTPAGAALFRAQPGTSTGDVLTAPGRGLPNPAGAPGDLHAHVRIVVPSRLSPAERRLFTQLAAASTFDPRADGSA
jgi:curved DNA-binding protein